jgi:xylan 1,4-beta-xylosidase
MCFPDQVQSDVFSEPVAIPGGVRVHLRVEVDFERLCFAYRLEEQDWQRLPGHLDASILSDEAATPGTPNFTGAFVGMCCQDMAGTRRHADFDYLVYEERGYRADPFSEDKR